MTGAQIITPNIEQARFVADTAKKLGLEIKPPIAYTAMMRHGTIPHSDILLDNAEEVIEKLLDQHFGGKIVTATVSYPIELKAREQEDT